MPKERIDTSPDSSPLAHNPFAALQALKSQDLPEHTAPPDEVQPAAAESAFRVERTRKGGMLIRTEKRAKGKLVTVVANVSGDAQALLDALKKHCGAGGVVREDTLEVQGDHRARIEAYIRATTDK